jgi:hypothetical protein
MGSESLNNIAPTGIDGSCKLPANPHKSIPGAPGLLPFHQSSPTELNEKLSGAVHFPFTRKLITIGMFIREDIPTFPPQYGNVSMPSTAPVLQ